MKKHNSFLTVVFATAFSLAAGLCACKDTSQTIAANTTEIVAPGAPGAPSHWSYAGKTGIGTSYEQYNHNQYQDGGSTGKVSKVWFSLAQGIITETMFGLIHEAQLQEMQFYIKGDGFLHEEKSDTISSIDYLDKDEKGRPLSLAYKIINRDKQGRYEIEKHIFIKGDDRDRIEIGSCPIKTKHGWLLVCCRIQNHSSSNRVFAIEAYLLDLKNPKKIIGENETTHYL